MYTLFYEADIRFALAWAYLAEARASPPSSQSAAFSNAALEAARARRMSQNMGYYWGKKAAAEVEAAIEHERENTTMD